MTVVTGIVADIIVSGDSIAGTDEGGMEASITTGKELERFLPVGTDQFELIRGMKVVNGTARAAWMTGGTLFQTLLDSDLTFEVTIQLTGDVGITASGCKVVDITRRVAPGTEVMTEEMTFSGQNWY